MKYLPGLNAIRFYAALSVLVHHVAGYAGDWFDQPRPYTILHSFILNPAYAVTLFFVLSGYLITTLLLNERRATGRIAVLDFYRRRVLRIWPLYYLVLGLSMVVALLGGPQVPFQSGISTALLIALLGNLVAFWQPVGISIVGHLWTIGVEEQFYAAWPQVVKRIRHPIRLLLLFVVFKLLLILAVYLLLYPTSDLLRYRFVKFMEGARFECMAIGAIGAYLVYQRAPVLRLLYSRVGQVAVMGLVIVVGFVIPPATPFHHVAVSFVFMAFMVNVSTNPRPLWRLEHPLIRMGGDISYGIYMLHPLVIYGTMLFLRGIGQGQNALLLNMIAIPGTMGLAWLSYRFFERPFLRLKARYTLVRSQSLAQ